jgi:hypothetical protein
MIPVRTLAIGALLALAVLSGTAGARAAPANAYSAGHGDIVVRYDPVAAQFAVTIDIVNGTVNGVSGVSVILSPADVNVILRATKTRPNDAPSFAFAPIGVGIGEPYYAMPQSNSEATALGVPWLGLRHESPTGTFVSNTIQIRLTGVSPPGGSPGDFSLWSFSGFTPVFHMASSNGITSADVLGLPIGHDHFNLGLAPASTAGLWTLSFEASGQRAAGGTITQPFQIFITTTSAAAAVPALPVPQSYALALLLVLAGSLSFGAAAIGQSRT